MDDDVAAFQRLDRADGEQAGIARTGTDQDDAPARLGIEKRCHRNPRADGTGHAAGEASATERDRLCDGL